MSGPAVETAPAGPAPGRPAAGGYIPVLDGLRAASIGLVLVGHYLDRAATTGRPDSPASRALRRPRMPSLGRPSSSLGLWRQMFPVPRTPEMSAVRRFPIDLAMALACAPASYHLVERPFLALEGRLAASRRPPGGGGGRREP